jgi:hypothetical protein
VDNDLARMGQEAVVAHFEVLSLVLPGRTDKTQTSRNSEPRVTI